MIPAPPPVPQLAVESSAFQPQKRQAAASKRSNETPTHRISTAVREARLTTPASSARLQIRTSGKGKQESWTVATTTRPLTKGSKQTGFRVRLSDVGFRVCLVYYDAQGKRREPYLCYLSAKEWQQSKRDTLASFVQRVTDKLKERTAKEGADTDKLNELAYRIRIFVRQQ